MNNKNIIYALLLIAATVFYRILNNSLHLFNFTPIVAVSLFAGAFLKNNKLAVWVPVLIMFLTDCFFQLFTNIPGFYGVGQLVNYGALVLVALLGSNITQPSLLKAGVFTIGSTLLFFILSNLGVWAFSPLYTKDFAGLSSCFAMALPFYNAESTTMFFNALFGNLGTSLLLFGAYYYYTAKELVTAKI
jgi:hypothetical protein